MTSHYVVGGGGTRLHVLETGNPSGQPILFIHGFSQCGLCWGRQLNSDLATESSALSQWTFVATGNQTSHETRTLTRSYGQTT